MCGFLNTATTLALPARDSQLNYSLRKTEVKYVYKHWNRWLSLAGGAKIVAVFENPHVYGTVARTGCMRRPAPVTATLLRWDHYTKAFFV